MNNKRQCYTPDRRCQRGGSTLSIASVALIGPDANWVYEIAVDPDEARVRRYLTRRSDVHGY